MSGRHMRRLSWVNNDLNSDDDKQDVSATAMPLINSKSDIRWPISETRQHGRKKIQKKLKLMMTGRVIMTAEKGRQKVSLSHINRKRRRERGDLLEEKGGKKKKGLFGLRRTFTPRLPSLGYKVEYLEDQLASRPVP